MRNIILVCLLTVLLQNSNAQLGVRYDPAMQPAINMQYFNPVGTNLFVGGCMPFSRNGTYYYYWLLDSAHHKSLNGLGGHQWVLSTKKDLKKLEASSCYALTCVAIYLFKTPGNLISVLI